MSEEGQIILPDGYTKLKWISTDGASYLQLPITTAAGDKVVLETNCRFYSLDNQADGTQWIDTSVIPDNETGLYFKGLQLTYGDFVPFGVTEGNNGIHPPRFSNKSLYYKWGETLVKMMTWDKADDLIFTSYLNFYNSKVAKFNSDDTDAYSQITSQAGTYTIPIRLFSYNFKGSYSADYGKWAGRVYRAQITQGNEYIKELDDFGKERTVSLHLFDASHSSNNKGVSWKGRIYRAQITEGDNIIRDFIPCLDADGIPCMYDIIEPKAYYNESTTSTFLYKIAEL